MACLVENGVLSPDTELLNEVASRFERDMNEDPERRAHFMAAPAAYLGVMGLNGDIQREILKDAGLTDIGAISASWCLKTCWCTACCITSITINNYSAT